LEDVDPIDQGGHQNTPIIGQVGGYQNTLIIGLVGEFYTSL